VAGFDWLLYSVAIFDALSIPSINSTPATYASVLPLFEVVTSIDELGPVSVTLAVPYKLPSMYKDSVEPSYVIAR